MLAADIAVLIPMPQLLAELGFRVNERTHRCACILHNGRNPGAFSWKTDGRWFCFSCGVGGDKFALVQQVKKCDFKDALRFLAALAGVRPEDNRKFKAELDHARCERKSREAAQEKLKAIELQDFLRAQKNILGLEALYRNAGRRLRELNAGSAERFANEGEVAWMALALVAREMPAAAAAYVIAAFADTPTRLTFSMCPNVRLHLIHECLSLGGVFDDRRYFFEFTL